MKPLIICFQLVANNEKRDALENAITSVIRGEPSSNVFCVPPMTFSNLPAAPFCYWATSKVLSVFRLFPNFESQTRIVRCGMGTLDDFRFLRCWWEVEPRSLSSSREMTCQGHGFVPYAKGGSASPFWAPIPLVVNYANDGCEVKAFVEQKVGSASRKIQSQNLYFRAGLCFGRRTHRLSPACLPAGSIFSDGSNAVFLLKGGIGELWQYLGLLNTRVVRALFTMCAPVRKMEVGYLQRMPVPELTNEHNGLEQEAKRGFMASFELARTDELSYAFVSPFPFLHDINGSFGKLVRASVANSEKHFRQLNEIEVRMEAIAEKVFGLNEHDVESATPPTAAMAAYEEVSDDDQEENKDTSTDEDTAAELADRLVSYLVGCVFGRWDIRYTIGGKPIPDFPDPFCALPSCSPGMLQQNPASPASEITAGYPLQISWSGILVDDPNHSEDIERRIREVIEVIWKELTEDIEHECCEILAVKSLRDYFRKPTGFFADHLKRYAKSRRQAPIYWPLSTASGSYTIWVYYHRLNEDFLYKVVNDYVAPKLFEVERRLAQVETDLSRAAGREATRLREAFEETKAFMAELQDLKAELLRVLALPYKPNLNDGALITAAPLWKLFRLPKWRNDLKECWEQLEAGDFDWAHLAYTIWPERVQEKCKSDRSLAIAHGVETLCETRPQEESPGSRRKRKARAAAPTES